MMHPPLGTPPRKVRLHPGARARRRGYNTMFLLTIVVLFGWASLDAFRWNDLSDDQRLLAIGFAIGAILVATVWRFVDNPIRHELRLARLGAVANGRIVELRRPKRRRGRVILRYAFTTTNGESITGECRLPRAQRVESLNLETEIEILCNPNDPRDHKPVLAFVFVDFGEAPKKA